MPRLNASSDPSVVPFTMGRPIVPAVGLGAPSAGTSLHPRASTVAITTGRAGRIWGFRPTRMFAR